MAPLCANNIGSGANDGPGNDIIGSLDRKISVAPALRLFVEQSID